MIHAIGCIVHKSWLISLLEPHLSFRSSLSCMSNPSINSFLLNMITDLSPFLSDYITLSFSLSLSGLDRDATYLLSSFLASINICFHCFSILAVTLQCLALQLDRAITTEHRRTYISFPSPSLSESGTSHSISLTLPYSVPHSLSLPSFSLTVSPSAQRREQHCWRILSYLPIPAEKGEERHIFPRFLFSPLDLYSSPQNSLLFPRFATVLVAF